MKYILLPGIGGSKIYCNCGGVKRRLYPKLIGNMSNHFYEQCPSTTTKPLKTVLNISIYKKIISRLGSEKCIIFSYDWRREQLDVAKNLMKFLITQETPYILIGHSNGGLIIRILLEYLNFSTNLIKHVFICGTPVFGSMSRNSYYEEPSIFKKILSIENKINNKVCIITNTDVEKIFKTYKTTLLYLVPSFSLLNIDRISNEGGIDIDRVNIISTIHKTLSKFRFTNYTLYFNVSVEKKNKIIMNNEEMRGVFFDTIPQISGLEYNASKGVWEVDYKIITDSLVVPTIILKNNSRVCFDYTPLSHSMIMNSIFLSNIIKQL